MGLTIAIIVVLFFLGRKLNHRGWLQATCFFGMLIATVVLCTGYFSLPAAVGYISWGVLLFLAKLTAPADSDQESQSIEESLDDLAKSPAVDALIDEAVEVINDMLEVGLAAHQVSEIDYEGFIIFNPTIISFVPRTVGIHIVMNSISDLRGCRHSAPAYTRRPEWADEMDKLDRFIEKYSYCYDSQRNQYVYETKNNIPVPYSMKEIPAAQIVDRARLSHEIERRCPLADFSNGHLHTKNVAHG